MYRRSRIAALCLCLCLSLSLIAPARATGGEVATLLIQGSPVDLVSSTFPLERYVRQSDGPYASADERELSTDLNRVSPGAVLTVQAKTQCTVYVETLTDLDGDGMYEWLDGGSAPLWDELSASAQLTVPGALPVWMDVGSSRTISAAALTARGLDVECARTPKGSTPIPSLAPSHSGDLIFCLTAVGMDGGAQTWYFQVDFDLDATLPLWQIGAAAFDDVPSWAWYWDAVDYAVRQQLLSGQGGGTFAPTAKVDRATLVQVLYNLADRPTADAAAYSDVKGQDWFAGAVGWAAQTGLTGGYEDGTFRPLAPLTREQLASIVHRFAQSRGIDQDFWFDLTTYPDGAAVSPWAQASLTWAVGSGILSGREDGRLDPAGPVTRGELSAVVYKLCTTLLPDPAERTR